VNITYSGIETYPSNPQSLIGYVKFTVKGSAKGILGTINNGADLATLLYYGFPIALLIGLIASVSSALIGVIAGIISGYYGGWIDEILMRITDTFMSIPFLLAAMVLTTILGNGLDKVMIAMTVFGWMGAARLIRANILQVKEEQFVLAASTWS